MGQPVNRAYGKLLLIKGALLTVMAGLVSGHVDAQGKPLTLHVGGGRSGQFTTVQAAVDALPSAGGTILIAPGSYREQVIIHQPHVTLKGTGADPGATMLVDDTSQGTLGTKPSYATVHVLGDDFHAENLTFENDFNRTHEQVSAGSQAQALNMEGDRNLLDHVRILGNQDTLYVGAKGCGKAGSMRMPQTTPAASPVSGQATPVAPRLPCTPAVTRSYFHDCVIAGNVDFIYGDGIAVFSHCEIHSTEHATGGYLTAQGKYLPDQSSTFVFDHCHLTAEPGQQHVYLGRPWRRYASVVFLNSVMDAHIDPAGWREWHPGETHYLDTVFYGEYNSTGPGASPGSRDPHSHQLTAEQAQQYDTVHLLAGADRWKPQAQAR